MPKKSTKKPVGPGEEEEKKLVSTSKKSSNEIDEIFAGKKRKKPGKDTSKTSAKAAEDGCIMKKQTRKKIKDNDKNPEIKENAGGSRNKKRTGDGLAIYTEEELGLGNPDAGSTPLCPFDCDCCF